MGIPPWRIRHTAPTSRLEVLPFSPMVKDAESAMMYVMDRLVSHYPAGSKVACSS